MATEKKQRKDPNKIDVILRLNKGDGLIFDVIDKCEEGKNKTDLIKNALFYYILHIQNGMAVDKNYPYNMVEGIRIDGLNRYLPVSNNFVDTNKVHWNDEEEHEEEYEEDYDEDNFDIE